MLHTIKGYQDTQEAAAYEAQIELRHTAGNDFRVAAMAPTSVAPKAKTPAPGV